MPTRLSCPVIFLQGEDDKVVPPNQAEAMVAALRAKGVPVAYLAFAGEGHGFRSAEAIERGAAGRVRLLLPGVRHRAGRSAARDSDREW